MRKTVKSNKIAIQIIILSLVAGMTIATQTRAGTFTNSANPAHAENAQKYFTEGMYCATEEFRNRVKHFTSPMHSARFEGLVMLDIMGVCFSGVTDKEIEFYLLNALVLEMMTSRRDHYLKEKTKGETRSAVQESHGHLLIADKRLASYVKRTAEFEYNYALLQGCFLRFRPKANKYGLGGRDRLKDLYPNALVEKMFKNVKASSRYAKAQWKQRDLARTYASKHNLKYWDIRSFNVDGKKIVITANGQKFSDGYSFALYGPGDNVISSCAEIDTTKLVKF